MISKEYLFNVRGFGHDAKCVSAVARLGSGHMFLGNPCIVDKDIFDLISPEDYITVVFPFSYGQGAKPFSTYNTKKLNITLKDSPCIVNNRVKNIRIFDFSKLKHLSNHVDKKGSATFSFLAHSAHGSAIPTGKNTIKFIDGIIPGILDRYRYHSAYYHNCATSAAFPKGDLRYILHFISIPNCTSVFNRRKVDGMGMVFNIISLNNTNQTGYVNPLFCLSIILSNYRENIFVIDGVSIAEKIILNTDYLSAAKKMIGRSIAQKGEYIIKQKKSTTKAEVKPSKEKDNTGGWEHITTGKDYSGSSATTVTTTAFSDSASYYYVS